MPAVAAELRDHAARLERHYADLCDIEFTIEDARLWMLQVRVGKRSPQAALRIAVDMAEDEAFPVSRALAVERVAPLLADPPRRRHEPRQLRATDRHRASRVARRGERPDRHQPRCRGGCRRGRSSRDPGPCRDLTRRRPRHGPSRRHPDVPRRPRKPRRGRRPRLGHPRRRRRQRDRGARRPGGRRRPHPQRRRGHHDRRQLGRGVRRRDPGHLRGRPRGHRRCSTGLESSASRWGRAPRRQSRPQVHPASPPQTAR